jgi:hypothetical protein
MQFIVTVFGRLFAETGGSEGHDPPASAQRPTLAPHSASLN